MTKAKCLVPAKLKEFVEKLGRDMKWVESQQSKHQLALSGKDAINYILMKGGIAPLIPDSKPKPKDYTFELETELALTLQANALIKEAKLNTDEFQNWGYESKVFELEFSTVVGWIEKEHIEARGVVN